MTIGIWVLGDQLWTEQAALTRCQQNLKETPVILIESWQYAQQRRYHTQQLVLIWLAMRHFAEELRAKGWPVTYKIAEDFAIPIQIEVIQKAEAAYYKDQLDLSSVEEFIRQVLGWQEYMHGVYSYMHEHSAVTSSHYSGMKESTEYAQRNRFNPTQPQGRMSLTLRHLERIPTEELKKSAKLQRTSTLE